MSKLLLKKGSARKESWKPYVLVKPREKILQLRVGSSKKVPASDELAAMRWIRENFRAVKMPNGNIYHVTKKAYAEFQIKARVHGMSVGELLDRLDRNPRFKP